MNAKKAKAARRLARKWSRAPLGYIDKDTRGKEGTTMRVLHPLSSRAIYKQLKQAYNDSDNNNNNNSGATDPSHS